jgi:hypothetical protein
MGRFAREHVEAQYKLSDEASAYADFLKKVAEARRRGELQAPTPYEQADLAAAIAASIADMPSAARSASSTFAKRSSKRRVTRRSGGFAPGP